ncbi:putative HTH-type transcriptional regulator YttP [Weizmannia acidilactici]|uniref:HTH-type transcriptional regulator YttP n=1 Tax=Weizmannia acidilactici TaxID=2607726 RepID=A0A5J4JG31_9BACI|nr:forespore capture DNA-binding protein RefZ [Weizmannia acidilactici]GER66407.1 putative HTH-type transcriptional regulator YttP [Weizmannia acidilactici]GER69447.1 putative HTH-type transcriptional regulator YttP [Weizmannia acidilactici]GER72224.1 putative HTH-type transcriptional regulator YttP [Weizmannia acidilactici]
MDGNGAAAKEKILNTAISLFHTYGYRGTTIRAIASAAKVNSANISYYYNGKQGLLEACFIRFFEPYIACLEEVVQDAQNLPGEGLIRAIRRMLYFQSENHLLSRFVWREVTIDSQIVREITSTYLMKERYLLKKLAKAWFGLGMQGNKLNFMVIQLRSMIAMPYLNSQYIREVWGMQPEEPYFTEQYSRAITEWLGSLKQNGEGQPESLLLRLC